MAHLEVFPSVFSATTYGFLHYSADLFAIAGPLVAELKDPVPEVTVTSLCALCVFVSFCVGQKSKEYY